MQQKSIGKRIWEVVSPLLVREVAVYVVSFIMTMVYYMMHVVEMMEAMQSSETMMEFVMETAYKLAEYTVEMTAAASLLALPFFIWMKHGDSKREKEAGLISNKKAPLSKYILVAGISIPLAIGLNNLITLSNLAQYSGMYQEAAEALYTPSLPVQILCLGIIIPIAEEYMFRGLIYRRIRSNTSAMTAIVVSAVFFGIYHGNLIQIIYGIVCGLLLAYLYEKYGSIKAPIFAHICMNVSAVLLTEVNAFTWMFTEPLRVAIITTVCAAVASSVFLLIQKIDEKPEMLQKC